MSKLIDMFKEFEEQEKIKPEKIMQKSAITPKVEIPKKIIEETFEETSVDWHKIIEKSSVQRSFIEILKEVYEEGFKGVDVRRSKGVMNKQLNKAIKKTKQIAGLVEKLREKYTPVYKECMNELEMELAKRKAKIENQ